MLYDRFVFRAAFQHSNFVTLVKTLYGLHLMPNISLKARKSYLQKLTFCFCFQCPLSFILNIQISSSLEFAFASLQQQDTLSAGVCGCREQDRVFQRQPELTQPGNRVPERPLECILVFAGSLYLHINCAAITLEVHQQTNTADVLLKWAAKGCILRQSHPLQQKRWYYLKYAW